MTNLDELVNIAVLIIIIIIVVVLVYFPIRQIRKIPIKEFCIKLQNINRKEILVLCIAFTGLLLIPYFIHKYLKK